jgi:hypothetical protein
MALAESACPTTGQFCAALEAVTTRIDTERSAAIIAASTAESLPAAVDRLRDTGADTPMSARVGAAVMKMFGTAPLIGDALMRTASAPHQQAAIALETLVFGADYDGCVTTGYCALAASLVDSVLQDRNR